MASAACLANSSSRSASSLVEDALRVAAEDDARADDLLAPPDRNADDGRAARPGRPAGTCPPGHLGVVVEHHRPAAGRPRRRSRPRSAGRRARTGTPRRCRPPCDTTPATSSTRQIDPASPPSSVIDRVEDPLQQRAQRELGAEVLHDGGQRRRTLALARPSGCGPGLGALHGAVLVAVGAGSGRLYGLAHRRTSGRRVARARGRLTRDAARALDGRDPVHVLRRIPMDVRRLLPLSGLVFVVLALVAVIGLGETPPTATRPPRRSPPTTRTTRPARPPGRSCWRWPCPSWSSSRRASRSACGGRPRIVRRGATSCWAGRP